MLSIHRLVVFISFLFLELFQSEQFSVSTCQTCMTICVICDHQTVTISLAYNFNSNLCSEKCLSDVIIYNFLLPNYGSISFQRPTTNVCLHSFTYVHFSGCFPNKPLLAFPLSFLPGLVSEENIWDKWRGVSAGQISFLSPNHHCRSTEGNTKHRPQPVTWPHPFFMYHWTPDGRDVARFMLALPHQYLRFRSKFQRISARADFFNDRMPSCHPSDSIIGALNGHRTSP